MENQETEKTILISGIKIQKQLDQYLEEMNQLTTKLMNLQKSKQQTMLAFDKDIMKTHNQLTEVKGKASALESLLNE